MRLSTVAQFISLAALASATPEPEPAPYLPFFPPNLSDLQSNPIGADKLRSRAQLQEQGNANFFDQGINYGGGLHQRHVLNPSSHHGHKRTSSMEKRGAGEGKRGLVRRVVRRAVCTSGNSGVLTSSSTMTVSSTASVSTTPTSNLASPTSSTTPATSPTSDSVSQASPTTSSSSSTSTLSIVGPSQSITDTKLVISISPTTNSSSGGELIAPTTQTSQTTSQSTTSSSTSTTSTSTSSTPTSVSTSPTSTSSPTSISQTPTTSVSPTSISQSPSTSSTSTTTSSSPASTPTQQLYTVDPDGNGPFSGWGTWFEDGLGACGWYNQSSDPIVAVSAQLFDNWPGYNGWNPNDNPICGLHLNITWGGKWAIAEVVDRCPGCDVRSLDFSEGLFEHFASLDVGLLGMASYTGNISWSWVSGTGSLPSIGYTAE